MIRSRITFLVETAAIGRGRAQLKGTVLDSDGNGVPRYVHVFATAHSAAKKYMKLEYVKKVLADSDGQWEADNLDAHSEYTVIAYDPAGAFDPVIKAGLKPEPME